jgi:hypothetical protein
MLQAGGTLCRTFAIVGYPREVGPGWLEPLLRHPGPVDVAVHIEPVPPQVAAERLRRQLARLESSRRLDADHGRLADFQAEAAAEDAHGLARRLACGDGRLFRVGLYVTVRGRDQAELDAESARVQGLLAGQRAGPRLGPRAACRRDRGPAGVLARLSLYFRHARRG